MARFDVTVLFCVVLIVGTAVAADPSCNHCTGGFSAEVRHAGNRASSSVSIIDFAFQAAGISINVGDTVTWKNTGGVAHTATSDTNVFDSGNLNPGQSFSFTFNTAGTFPYHCNIHPSMMGTINVSGSPAAPAITSPLTASATVGVAFSYTINATGTSPITFGISALPAGLTSNGNVISGTPTAAGVTNVTLTATNSAGTDSKTLVLSVTAGGTTGLNGQFVGKTRKKSFSLTSGKAVNASQAMTITFTQAGTTLIAMVVIQESGGPSTYFLSGMVGNNSFWAVGPTSDGTETQTLTGHINTKGDTITGVGITHAADGLDELTYSVKKPKK